MTTQLEISAKIIFNLVQKLGKGEHGSFQIFEFKDHAAKRFRIKVKDLGDFEIGQYQESEQFELKRNDWIWVEKPYYRYSCCSTTYNGSPIITIQQAFKLLNDEKSI